MPSSMAHANKLCKDGVLDNHCCRYSMCHCFHCLIWDTLQYIDVTSRKTIEQTYDYQPQHNRVNTSLAGLQTHLLVTQIFVVVVLLGPLDTSCRQYT